MATGIRPRHARACRARTGGRCNCEPSYEAWVWSVRDGRKIRRTFPTQAAAKRWRADAGSAVRRGAMRAPSGVTVRDAAEAWLAGVREGAIRNRSGDPYKPSVMRSYETSLRLHVYEPLGGVKLADLRRADIQRLAERMLKNGAKPSTIRNAVMPLRAIYRRHRDEIPVNPTEGLELPAVRGRRDRIASPDEAAALLEALPATVRAVWATAFYAGLRLGELRGLRWSDIDFAHNVIRVERSWDAKEGEIEPKSYAGRRKVPVPKILQPVLLAHKLAQGRAGEGLVFGRGATEPFGLDVPQRHADKAWKALKLERITLHEARHTYASLMIAAGVNIKALSTFMGHASVAITWDRYGHLVPGSEDEAAGLFDAYLERAVNAGNRVTGAHTGAQAAQTAA